MDEGKWSGHSYNMKDRMRVAYVIEKKEKQREEQLAKNGNVELLNDFDSEPEGKKRKRNLKSDKNKQVVENNNSNDELENNKKGKNFYKKK